MQASESDEHKLLKPSQPEQNLQIEGAKQLQDGQQTNHAHIEAQMQEFEANGPRRSGRLSMSPIMTQILRQQIVDIRQLIQQYQVLPTRNTSRYDYEDVPNHLDILLFGPAGAGKTSLIKTFYRALHERHSIPDQIESSLTVKDRHSNEGTTNFTKVMIKPDLAGDEEETKSSSSVAQSGSEIVIHDTRGQIWMDDREMAQLNLMIKGKINDRSLVEQRNHRYAFLLWEFWKRDTELFPPQIINERKGLKSKPHCVCFVFDGSMDEIPNGEEEINFYKDILEMARNRGYNSPQVILTCIDKVEQIIKEEEEDRLGRPLDDFEREQKLREVIDQKIEKVVIALGVPRASVHFIENYKTSFNLDAVDPATLEPEDQELFYSDADNRLTIVYRALRLLNECINQGESFMQQNLKERKSKGGCTIQ